MYKSAFYVSLRHFYNPPTKLSHNIRTTSLNSVGVLRWTGSGCSAAGPSEMIAIIKKDITAKIEIFLD